MIKMTLNDAKRIVFKVGTSTLTYEGGGINIRRVEKLVKILSDIKNQGREVILVTSGAIGVGMGKMGISQKPSATREKQALAAIGQCELMDFYSRLFSEYNHTVAQLLLTRDVVEDGVRKENAHNTLSTLLSFGIIPIINENDSVSSEQIEFGDNDTLSAIVARLIDADCLVILSDIDGLYDSNPNDNPDAKLISVVEEITDEIRKSASGAGTGRGTRGMITKLTAAEIATKAGIDMYIVNGSEPEIIYDLLDGKGVGTLFCAGERTKS
jgi:glutamate 5-kinase